MINKAMERSVADGDALDISQCERTADGDYILDERLAKMAIEHSIDFCDAKEEGWIWSIGQSLADSHVKMADGMDRILPKGTCLASRGTKFQSDSPGWRGFWLR